LHDFWAATATRITRSFSSLFFPDQNQRQRTTYTYSIAMANFEPAIPGYFQIGGKTEHQDGVPTVAYMDSLGMRFKGSKRVLRTLVRPVKRGQAVASVRLLMT
jgi:hypothetical protein